MSELFRPRRGRRVVLPLLVAICSLVSACGAGDEPVAEVTTTVSVLDESLAVDEAELQSRLHEFIDRSGATAVMASIKSVTRRRW